MDGEIHIYSDDTALKQFNSIFSGFAEEYYATLNKICSETGRSTNEVEEWEVRLRMFEREWNPHAKTDT